MAQAAQQQDPTISLAEQLQGTRIYDGKTYLDYLANPPKQR